MKNSLSDLFLSSGCLSERALRGYAAGTLAGEETSAVKAHLEECELCRDAMEGFRDFNDPDQFEKTVNSIRQEVLHTVNKRSLHGYQRQERHIVLYVALAASLLVFAGIYTLWRKPPSTVQQPFSTVLAENGIEIQVPTGVTSVPVSEARSIPPPEKNKPIASSHKPITIPEKTASVYHADDPIKKSEGTRGISREYKVEAEKENEERSMAEESKKDMAVSPVNTEVPKESAWHEKMEKASRSGSRIHTAGPSAEDRNLFYSVEEMPMFRHGDVEKFRNFIQKKLRYPYHSAEEGIEGIVYVSFVVEPDGKVSNAKIYQGVSPELDKEALRVIMTSPSWQPGRHQGKAVPVAFILPVKFALR